MKTKRALCIILAVLTSACAGVPTWDTSDFPQQVVYGAPGTPAPTITATAPAK